MKKKHPYGVGGRRGLVEGEVVRVDDVYPNMDIELTSSGTHPSGS